ncbi:MAG: hypothetical protein KatS3mg082_1458 [Nitrospiraceae bacterium]|nr:MAG: hypothetical protein KatS3mg082_1458 [Nitrospiraceae bacterium]
MERMDSKHEQVRDDPEPSESPAYWPGWMEDPEKVARGIRDSLRDAQSQAPPVP